MQLPEVQYVVKITRTGKRQVNWKATWSLFASRIRNSVRAGIIKEETAEIILNSKDTQIQFWQAAYRKQRRKEKA